MIIIRFSHRYKKMPPDVEYLTTWITGVKVIELSDLTPEQIKQDTETIHGTFYPLKPGRYIWIDLWSDAIPQPVKWQTIRPYNPGKEKYYRDEIGKEIGIEICRYSISG